MEYHIENIHEGSHPSLTCQICDKNIGYKSLERHMKEVHGEEKFQCEKCPAAFTRNSELEKHIREGWHYLTYYCKQCQKTLVFKHLGGLIEHVIVKQSEGEQEFDGTKWKIYKSGIMVTCKSQVQSIQLEEGEHVLCMPRNKQVEAAKKRAMKKEEIINVGLQLPCNWDQEAAQVKLEFEYKKHQDDGTRKCKWCSEHLPFSKEYCPSRKPGYNWQLQGE